jgi:hypothetical protein
MTTIAQLEPSRVTVGVDTHGEVHVACASTSSAATWPHWR